MIDREDTPDLFAKTTSQEATPPEATRPVPPQASPPATDASIGERLRGARQAKGLSIAACAHELCLPIRVLERLEHGDLGEPTHFVFIKGALSSYARLLGLPEGSCEQALRTVAPAEQPALVSVTRTSAARWLLQRYGTAATYIVLTATIAVPLVLLGLRGGLERPAARIVSLDQAPAASAAQVAHDNATAGAPEQGAASPDATPFRASMTPFAAIGLGDIGTPGTKAAPQQTPVVSAPLPAALDAGPHALTIAADGDCWFEITDAKGDAVDSGMLHAGDSRTWHSAGVLHVTLGNAGGVSVTRDGEPFMLAPHQRANVARFDVFASDAGGIEKD